MLSFRQRLTWLAHFFKALAYQYHRDFGTRIGPLIPAAGVVLDVGAHSGQFAKLFGRLVPQGTVYAFEPGHYALSILRPVLQLRGFRNVRILPVGLSDRAGAETLNVPLKKSGTMGFGLAHLGEDVSGRQVARQRIELTTLDDFAAAEKLQRLDFIKADIEGMELHFLRGAMATIGRLRPALMLEVVPWALSRVDAVPQDIFDLFAPLGYRVFRTREHDGYRFEPVHGFAGAADYLFVPEEKVPLLPAG